MSDPVDLRKLSVSELHTLTQQCTDELNRRKFPARCKLVEIRDALRLIFVNPDGGAKYEHITTPNFDYNEHDNLVVDSFLYEDDEMDDMFQEGIISSHLCVDCGSRNIHSSDIVSHSFSMDDLEILFQSVLPDLHGKTLVDVGSRLGTVLYGGYVLSNAKLLIGIEMNQEFCSVSKSLLERFDMNDRTQVVNADVRDCIGILSSADIVVFHNVFEYFLTYEENFEVWNTLLLQPESALRTPGKVIVSSPPFEELFKRGQIVDNLLFLELLPTSSEEFGVYSVLY